MESEGYLIDGEWETISTEPLASEHALPDGNAADLWQRVFSGNRVGAKALGVDSTGPTPGHVLSLEELARLLDRPRPRRHRTPEGQLTLFAA